MNQYQATQQDQLDALQRLILALKVMPGIGPKSAQRMAYYLLQHDRNGALSLGVALQEAVEKIAHCSQCNSFSEILSPKPKSAQLVTMIVVMAAFYVLLKLRLIN